MTSFAVSATSDVELLVGARAIGAAMGVSAKRIYDMTEAGQFPAVKLGGSIAIRKAKLLEFLEGLETASVRASA